MWIFLKKERWSPYAAGMLIGLLATASLILFNKTIGTSVTFVKMAALFWYLFDPSHVQNSPYYQQYLQNKAWIDWQVMLVIGIFLGAYLSRRMGQKTPRVSYAPSVPKKRLIQAFIGGIIVMFGARLAGGCTSGHAISGGTQLSLSGWLFMMGVFALGIPTAFLMYRKKGVSA